MSEGRYYWLKLRRDFFKRHDIRVLSGMCGGTAIVLFYLKLLCESVDHEGRLRFSEKIPYTEAMLSALVDMNEQDAGDCLEILMDLGMVIKEEDGTYFLPEVPSMIGSQSATDEAERQRRRRERIKERDTSVTEPLQERDTSVTLPLQERDTSVTNRHESKSKSKSKSTEKEQRHTNRFVPPSADEVREYAASQKYTHVDPEAFIDFYASKGWKVGKDPMKDWKAAVRNWERRHQEEAAKPSSPTRRNSFQNVPADRNEANESWSGLQPFHAGPVEDLPFYEEPERVDEDEEWMKTVANSAAARRWGA